MKKPIALFAIALLLCAGCSAAGSGSAAAAGKEVTVIEAASQILGRSLTPQLAQRIREIHEAAGIRIIDSASIDSISAEGISTDKGFVDAEKRSRKKGRRKKF